MNNVTHPMNKVIVVPASIDMMLAALLELDLEAARQRSHRVGPLKKVTEQGKGIAATKRANRSILNEIAAWMGISRSMVNTMRTPEQRKHPST